MIQINKKAKTKQKNKKEERKQRRKLTFINQRSIL